MVMMGGAAAWLHLSDPLLKNLMPSAAISAATAAFDTLR